MQLHNVPVSLHMGQLVQLAGTDFPVLAPQNFSSHLHVGSLVFGQIHSPVGALPDLSDLTSAVGLGGIG